MKRMWSEEEIQSFKKDISNLVDSKRNPRFVEGEGTPATIEGFTSTYCKWSLSGTHLMLVLAGTFANASTIPSNIRLCTFNLPNYIMDKIKPIISSNGAVEYKNLVAYYTNTTSQTLNTFLRKTTEIIIVTNESLTLTADRTFRIQFDILIDTE